MIRKYSFRPATSEDAPTIKNIENILFDKYETIYLQSFKENAQAVRFYLKNGWKTTEETSVPEIGNTMLSLEKTGKATNWF